MSYHSWGVEKGEEEQRAELEGPVEHTLHRGRDPEPNSCCVTLSKSHTLSELQFLQLQSRDHSIYFRLSLTVK